MTRSKKAILAGALFALLVAAVFAWPAAAQAAAIERVSVAGDGSQSNANSQEPSISADGRYVAFRSLADDLAPGDGSGYDLFLRDRVAGTTILVTAADDETPADGDSQYAAVSADGRYVAFQSEATNLVGVGATRTASWTSSSAT